MSTAASNQGEEAREAPSAVLRTDLLAHAMNPGKERKVWALLFAWRRCAKRVAAEQWRRFYAGEGFWEDYRNPEEGALAAIAGAANRVQMVRYQTVGTLKSFLSNRQNDFVRRVQQMSLDAARRPWLTPRLKHEMLFINRWQGWFKRDLPAMPDGEPVSQEARAAARWLMRDILAHHRRPDFSRVNMVLDARAVELTAAVDPVQWRASEAAKAQQRKAERARRAQVRKAAKAAGLPLLKAETGKRKTARGSVIPAPRVGRDAPTLFPLWVSLSTMTPRAKILVPLLAHECFNDREGERKLSVQVNARDGRLYFGVITDIGAGVAEARKDYEPKTEEIALDWGMRTLFGTDRGGLLGRGFLDHLVVIDRRLTRLAAYRQKHGLRVRSPRYDREVQRLRGFLRSEIGRVLNRLVEMQRPGRIVVERLDFRAPNLSRRMNRLITNAGRKIIKDKLQDLEERFGIEALEVPAAYSSQECSACGYVDGRNRSGERFRCLWCGRKLHADVNAPRNLQARRTRTFRTADGEIQDAGRPTKACVLFTLVHDFMRQCEERSGKGRRGTSRDPRLVNPYFKRWVDSSGVISSCNAHTPAVRKPAAQTCAAKQ